MTLVELIVALTILSGVIVLLMAGFSWSLDQTGLSNQRSVAVNLARERLESAKAEASSGAGFAALQSGGDARAAVPGTAFDRELLVAYEGSINILTLTANVYPTGAVQPPVVSLQTVVYQ